MKYIGNVAVNFGSIAGSGRNQTVPTKRLEIEIHDDRIRRYSRSTGTGDNVQPWGAVRSCAKDPVCPNWFLSSTPICTDKLSMYWVAEF